MYTNKDFLVEEIGKIKSNFILKVRPYKKWFSLFIKEKFKKNEENQIELDEALKIYEKFQWNGPNTILYKEYLDNFGVPDFPNPYTQDDEDYYKYHPDGIFIAEIEKIFKGIQWSIKTSFQVFSDEAYKYFCVFEVEKELKEDLNQYNVDDFLILLKNNFTKEELLSFLDKEKDNMFLEIRENHEVYKLFFESWVSFRNWCLSLVSLGETPQKLTHAKGMIHQDNWLVLILETKMASKKAMEDWSVSSEKMEIGIKKLKF